MTVRLGGVVITNPSKPFWPDDGLTKLDLAKFYTRIASQILPWLKGRPVTMERCPDGIRTKCFYQKQAPANLPDGVPTMSLPAPTVPGDVDYIIGGSRKTLLALVNFGCIAMHVMNSRTDHLDRPDWLAFDLDPSDGFESAARAALLLRDRLEDHGLESFPKTSGGRGLHVFVPLRRGAPQDQVRAYAAAIARELAAQHPRVVTVEARKARRRAPVYLDVMRNAHRTDYRAAVLGAVAAICPGLDAAQLGRSQPAAQPRHLQHPNRRATDGQKISVGEVFRQ